MDGSILVVFSSLGMQSQVAKFPEFPVGKGYLEVCRGFGPPKYPDPLIARAILRTYTPLG